MAKTRVPLLYGTMTMGEEGKEGVRTYDPKENQNILDAFFSYGHKEIDTARRYADGSTEPTLAKLDLHGATVDTKILPVNPGDHSPEKLRSEIGESIKQLGTLKIRALYLHSPDRSVPIKETLEEINKLYNEGKFEIFGLSNYASWEVAEIVGICDKYNWVKPKIYEAMYNAITRAIESELVPCCRKFGLRIVTFNPLAGGFFSGKIKAKDEEPPKDSRFNSNSGLSKEYRERYFQQSYFDALALIQGVADKHNIKLTSIALRWCQHHSILTPEDGIIIGASGVEQVKQNCEDSEEGPLPQDVVDALDEASMIVGVDVPKYWH